MAVVPTREEGTSGKQLGKDAPNCPDINRLPGFIIQSTQSRYVDPHLGVHLERQHDLWCAIPPGGDILGHEANVLARRDGGLYTPG
jgi:hypothetical protein